MLRRRRRDTVVLLAGMVAVGLVALLAASAGGPGERVLRLWLGAEVGVDGTRLMIGDPDATVTGTRRYRIEYGLSGLGDDDELAWYALGDGWEVPVEYVEAHVTSAFALSDTGCASYGSGGECTLGQPAPGRLDAVQHGIEPYEGLTLYARNGAALPSPAPLSESPAGPSATVEPADGAPAGWLWATAAALLAAVIAGGLVRLAGREHVRGDDGRSRRVDVRRLAASVRPSPEPPVELGPAQAGILLTDRVRREHQAAWLLAATADGHVTITGSAYRPTLQRTGTIEATDPLTHKVLRAVFARKGRVTLGQYDKSFATGWKLLKAGLQAWRRAGGDGLWLPSGERRRRFVLWSGVVAAVAGTVVVAIAATTVTALGAAWRQPLAGGAVLAGAGLAALIRAWELRARTVRGSRLWCEAEAYRRHLAGLGRQGTDHSRSPAVPAWALALGESKALPAAAPAGTPRRDAWSRQMDVAAHLPMAAAIAARTPPSSGSSNHSSTHSSGGDGGGGSGGGDSGGSGGSW